MSEPVKILEIEGQDWAKGISLHPYIAVGGIFQEATNFDPFIKYGVYEPTYLPSEKGTNLTMTAGKFNVVYNYNNGSYIVNFANGGKAYLVTLADETMSDISSDVTDVTTISGAALFKSKIVYANRTSVIAGSIPLAVGSRVTLLSGATVLNYDHIMKIGPDRNLWMTNGNYISKITSISGTTGNTAQYLAFESDVITRDIENDGKYLVIAGDTNAGLASGNISGVFRCFISFWNMQSQDLSQIWEIQDAGILFIKKSEDEILVQGVNNLYVCSVNSPPKIVQPFRGNTTTDRVNPHPGSVTTMSNGAVVWGGESRTLYGYGRLHPSLNKIMFKPHLMPLSGSNNFVKSMVMVGGFSLWVMSSDGEMFKFSSSGTSQTSTTVLSGIDFKKPYEFSFIKVILSEPLADGDSVDVEIKTDEGSNTVLKNTRETSNSFSFANFGAKKSHVFYPVPGATATASLQTFEDISDFTIRNIGASVRRIEVWAKPLRPDQDAYR